MAGIIIYKGKYGATAQYANWLAEELKIPVCQALSENNEILNYCNYVVLGSSVYVGKLQLAKWIRQHHTILQGKKIFLFVVCATPSNEKEKLNTLVQKNIPYDLLQSTELFFMRGRMNKSRLSAFDRFVLKMGASLVKDPVAKRKMLTDFDDVKKENLNDLISRVEKHIFQNRIPTHALAV